MNREFVKIYQERLEYYRAVQLRYDWPWDVLDRRDIELLALADNAIDRAISSQSKNLYLRPDARLFLLINLHQIVLLPLAHRSSPTELTPEVEEGVQVDIARIIEASMEFKEDGELPASSIVKGLATVIDKLSLKSWRLWDSND